MKKLLFAFMLLATIKSSAQCWTGSTPYDKRGEGSQVTAAVIIDNSLHYWQPSGFGGFGLHAGVWIDWIGLTVGGVESKMSEKAIATRAATFSILGRYTAFEEKVQIVPFFTVGTDNFQDVGIRIGYRLFDGVYLGGVASRSMKYGLNFCVSVNKQK